MTHRSRRAELCQQLFEDFVPDVSRSRTPERILQVAELASQGYYSHEVAEMIGITPKAVQKIYRRYDFPSLHNFALPLQEERGDWKGGIKLMKGYMYKRTPHHPHGTKHGSYVAVHRLVVEEHIGRYLLPSEVVDHIDGDITNNDISNLRVFESNAEHLRATLKGKTPNWSDEGKRHISEGVRAARKRENAIRERLRNDAGQYMKEPDR